MTDPIDQSWPVIPTSALGANDLFRVYGPNNPDLIFTPAIGGGGGGGGSGFLNVATFIATSVSVEITDATILGYYSPGIPITVRRVNSQPTHLWKFQTADGGWWEGYPTEGWIAIEQFGAHADGTNDDWNAWNAANLYCIYCNANNLLIPNIYFPNRHYKFSQTLTPGTNPATPLVAGCSVTLIGQFFPQSGGLTTFSFPVDTRGVWFTPFAYGGRIKNIVLTAPTPSVPGGGGSNVNADGITIRCPYVEIDTVQITNFAGNGITIQSGDIGDGFGYTNCDDWLIKTFQIQYCGGKGLYVDGPDSTLGNATSGDIQRCGGVGIWDSAYFPNNYTTIQISFCGMAPYQIRPGQKGGIVNGSNGYQYFVRPNQDAAASTTDPTTDATEAVWILWQTTPGAYWPTWNNGDHYQCGCFAFSSKAQFNNIYSESGSGVVVPAILSTNSFSFGNGTFIVFNGSGIRPAYYDYLDGTFLTYGGMGTAERIPITNSSHAIQAGWGNTFDITIGGSPETGRIFQIVDQLSSCQYHTILDRTNKDFYTDLGPLNAAMFRMGGQNTANQYGRGAAQKYVVNVTYGFLVGNGANARYHLTPNSGTWPPTDGDGGNIAFLKGDFAINVDATYNSWFMRVCVANGTGSAATFYGIIAAPVNFAFNSVSTAPTANNLNLTAANITGGIEEVTLALTNAIGAPATATLPTVADLVTALGDKFYPGKTYILWIANAGGTASAWTLTTNTGWSALSGTLTIAQNKMRKFIITLGNATSGSVQATGETADYS